MKNFSKVISALILSGLIASPVCVLATEYKSLPKSQTCSCDVAEEKLCMGEEIFKEAVKQTIFNVGTHILKKYMPKNNNQYNNNSNNSNNNNYNTNNNSNQNNQQSNVVEEKMVPVSSNNNNNSNSGVPSSTSQPVVEEMIPL